MPIKKFLKTAHEIQAQADAKSRSREPSSSPRSGDHDESGWLVSYADMMTLLCGFFIMLFSMANMDPPKYDAAKKSISEQFGGKYTPDTKTEPVEAPAPAKPEAKAPDETTAALAAARALEAQQLELKKVLELPDTQAQVQKDPWGISIVVQSNVLFDTVSAELRPEGMEVLKKLTTKLSQDSTIVVEGYTDSRPIIGGAFASNWELSTARATRVVRLFLNQKIAPEHLVALGYGDTHPLVPDRDPQGRYDEAALEKNRRVVIRILDPKAQAIPLPAFAGRALAAEPKAAVPVKSGPGPEVRPHLLPPTGSKQL